MKLITKTQAEDNQPVTLTLEQDDEDVNLFANGVLVLWIDGTMGCVVMAGREDESKQLAEMGFQIDSEDQVVVR